MMQTKGFKTPRAALKWLRQEIRAKRRKERMDDAKLMRDMRAGLETSPAAAAASGALGTEGESSGAAAPPPPLTPEQGARLNEAFGDETFAENLNQAQFAIDPESKQLMRWDPERFAWDFDHPEIDEMAEMIDQLPDQEYAQVVGPLVQRWDPLLSETQRAGARRVAERAKTPESPAEPAPQPKRNPLLLPSREMLQAGAANLLFGGPQRTRELTGGINKRLAELQKKRKKKRQGGQT